MSWDPGSSDPGKLAGKVALITGASKGIGRGIAEVFAREGAHLALLSRTDAGFPEALNLTGDVADEAAVERAFAASMERYGRLDILVNNAALFHQNKIDVLPTEVWDRLMAVNLRGAFLCTRAAFRIMKAQGGGRILNIGSISGRRPREANAAYATSKFALRGLTDSTALEGREFGIACGILNPGNVLAEWRRNSPEPMMQVADVAEAVLAMAVLPPQVNLLDATILPLAQPYLGRG